LAETYATRTIRLLDGNVIADSDPYDGSQEPSPEASGKKKHASMSALTAFSLSLSNLMTKKGRAILTAFAGSIGIVGIALILSISTGVNNYIEGIERDTLSSYPLTLESQTMDMGGMMNSMNNPQKVDDPKEDHIYSSNVMSNVMDLMFSSATSNNLTAFKHFIESGGSGLEDLTSEIRYIYSTPLNIYKADITDGIYQVNPSSVFSSMGMDQGGTSMGAGMGGGNMDVWSQLSGNRELLEDQYEVVNGRLPNAWNEVVVIVDENNRITDYTLYALGILDISVLQEALQQKLQGKDVQIDTTIHEYTYDDFIGLNFKILASTDYYKEVGGKWMDMSEDELYLSGKLQAAEQITVVGILRPQPNSSVSSGVGIIGYPAELMTHMIGKVNESAIVKAQLENPDVDVFTGLPFPDPDAEKEVYTMAQIEAMLPMMPPETQAQLQGAIAQMRGAGMPDEQIAAYLSQNFLNNSAKTTLEQNLTTLGVSDLDKPSAINLYPKDFESKDKIAEIITQYNAGKAEEDKIIYTDYVGLMMSSITTIINAISYILISFVGISLVVSSIMIGIITNISVLERTKEIGILRAVGASKGDVSRVFNAETVIEGLAAGLVGIGLTELLIIPINLIIQHVAGLNASAFLPPVAAVILVLISVGLTFLAGLIPAASAANKDPVVALRSE
jgi:putative ABC transport system permease protein